MFYIFFYLLWLRQSAPHSYYLYVTFKVISVYNFKQYFIAFAHATQLMASSDAHQAVFCTDKQNVQRLEIDHSCRGSFHFREANLCLVSYDLSFEQQSIRSSKQYNFRSKCSPFAWSFYGWIVNNFHSKSIDSTCLACVPSCRQTKRKTTMLKQISIFFATWVYRRITNFVLSHLYIYIVCFYIALK